MTAEKSEPWGNVVYDGLSLPQEYFDGLTKNVGPIKAGPPEPPKPIPEEGEEPCNQ